MPGKRGAECYSSPSPLSQHCCREAQPPSSPAALAHICTSLGLALTFARCCGCDADGDYPGATRRLLLSHRDGASRSGGGGALGLGGGGCSAMFCSAGRHPAHPPPTAFLPLLPFLLLLLLLSGRRAEGTGLFCRKRREGPWRRWCGPW